MAENEIVKGILYTYEQIEVLNEEGDIVFFKLKENIFGIWYFDYDKKSSRPIIIIKNDNQYDFPHILPFEIPMDKEKQMYRFLCLHESRDTINYLMSFEEKVIDAIDQLIRLLSLTQLEIEEEFQKEFLYYWNSEAHNTYGINLYIRPYRVFQKLNSYRDSNEALRLISNGIKLNDKNDNWSFLSKMPAFYIPIEDNRRILPPVKNKSWTKNDIFKIIKGMDIPRISENTVKALKEEKIKSNMVFLIFEMIVNNQSMNFTCLLKFKNKTPGTLVEKVESSFECIELLKSKRCDYYFLNKQIGNDVSLLDKNVAIIGAGSLGSYLASELVRSGIKNITIYDEDDIEDENIMRHRAEIMWSGCNKAVAIKAGLQLIHPEIFIEAVNKNITEDKLKSDMEKFDMIIFTVGSSDIQLDCNRIFKASDYGNPVIYAWLEAGGNNSHILKIDYSEKGCFECLYTNENGDIINNKANKLSDKQLENSTIRNGCGGTRVAYGTETLMRTTSSILDVIKRTLSGELNENCLIDIETYSIESREISFVERKCKCCGDRNS